MLKKIFLLFFFVSASIYGVAQGGAQNSFYNSKVTAGTIIGTVGKLVKVYHDDRTTIIQQMDTTVLTSILHKEIESIICILTKQMDKYEQNFNQLDQENANNKNAVNQLSEEIEIYKEVIQILKNRLKEKEKFNYLPLGVHQFTNGQIGKGIFFAVSETGLLGAGIAYCLLASNSLKKHKNNTYDQWERDRFYNKYKDQRRLSGWLFAGSVLAIGLNYCDNFNWFRKSNIELVSMPAFDDQGKPQIAMSLNVRF